MRDNTSMLIDEGQNHQHHHDGACDRTSSNQRDRSNGLFILLSNNLRPTSSAFLNHEKGDYKKDYNKKNRTAKQTIWLIENRMMIETEKRWKRKKQRKNDLIKMLMTSDEQRRKSEISSFRAISPFFKEASVLIHSILSVAVKWHGSHKPNWSADRL